MILRRCYPTVISTSASSSTPADEYAARGQAAFEAKQYLEAWHAFRTAFEHERTPTRASQTAFAAPYAVRMSAALEDLRHWLLLERQTARQRSNPESWLADLEAIMNAYVENSRRAEQTNSTQRSEIESLEQQILVLKQTIQRLEADTQRRLRKPTFRAR